MHQFGNLKHHFFQYKFYYLIIFVLFLAGFLVGGFYSNLVSSSDFNTAKETADAFILSAKNRELNYQLILWEDFPPYLWIFFCGFFLFGFSGTLFFSFKNGFSTGFFLSFLIKAFSLKGFFLSGFFLFCELLFFLPALLFVSVRSLRISSLITSSTLRPCSLKHNIKAELFWYLVCFAASALLSVTGSMVKFFLVSPLCNYLFV